MYIGIDIGGTGIKAGLVDTECNILAKESCATPLDSYEAIVNAILGLAEKVAERGGYKMSDIESIGIGCPGAVDDKNGVVIYSNNIPFPKMTLGHDLSERTGLPVYLGNDANCAALGEFYALDDKGISNFVAVTLGTGVGGGIVINKKLYTGFNGAAGELGHTLLYADGEPCTCGRRGCWEAYASATALIREAEKKAIECPDSLLAKMIAENGGKSNGKIPFDAAKQGDEVGSEVVHRYTKAVADGIVNVINMLQPEVIVIGGGISKEGAGLIDPVMAYLNKYVYGSEQGIPFCKVRLAKLGNDAGIVGAALLGIEK